LSTPALALAQIQQEVVACALCPRLREHCAQVAIEKRRAYRDWTYWGKPVPSFGDPRARLLLIGLAPGAHGANRTGRMFTGDSSGDFLYRALYDAGFATQPESRSADDGLKLRDCYISAAGHCAPPDNKPLPEELARCRPYLERELQALTRVKSVVALGRIAFETYLSIAGVAKSQFPFAHGGEYEVPFTQGTGAPVLIASYHPSQQNTSTGRLTRPMFDAIFQRARHIVEQKA
jgi:uracil-DNA glycosylase